MSHDAVVHTTAIIAACYRILAEIRSLRNGWDYKLTRHGIRLGRKRFRLKPRDRRIRYIMLSMNIGLIVYHAWELVRSPEIPGKPLMREHTLSTGRHQDGQGTPFRMTKIP